MRARPDSLHRLAVLRRPDDADPVSLSPVSVGTDLPTPPPAPARAWPTTAESDLPATGIRIGPSPAVLGGWTPDTDAFWTPRVDGPIEANSRHDQPSEPELDVHQVGRPPAVAPGNGSTRYPRRHRWTRLTQRWVPEPLRDSRVDPGRRAAMLLVLIAAVAAVAAAVGVWRERPEPRPVQAVALPQVTDATGTGLVQPTGQTRGTIRMPPATSSVRQSVPTPEPPAVLVVSVTGAVARPGLVRLTAGSRVADAIAKAGGATRAADLTGLNLAAVLSDGDSVVIADSAATALGTRSSAFLSAGSGSTGSGPPSGATGTGGNGTTGGRAGVKLNINTADAAALDALPGVGPVTASNIVAWRQKNGRFTSVEQLQEISGIGPAKYAALAPQVTL